VVGFQPHRLAARIVTAAILVSALGLLLPAGASAFDISDFTVTPSTTQAGAHPDLTVSLTRTGTDDEDILDQIIDLPPGMIGNPEAVDKCSEDDWLADTCPASSQVGTVTSIASAAGMDLPPVNGSVYVLDPNDGEAGALGIILRPTGSPLAISPVYLRASIVPVKVGDDYTLRNLILNIPNQVFVLGTIPVDITINSITLTLNGAGTHGPGSFFLTNPTGCTPATTKLEVVSYLNQTVDKEASFTPTGCESVPFTPTFEVEWSTTSAGMRTAPDTVITFPPSEDPLHQSHVKSVTVAFPPGVALDFVSALTVAQCTDAQFEADQCPAGSKLGFAEVSVPPLPPDFVGEVYRVLPAPGDAYGIGAVVRGARGIKTAIRGSSAIVPVDLGGTFTYQAIVKFPVLPQIPFTKFRMKLTNPILVNPPTCGPKTTQVDLVGYSGATAHPTETTTIDGCYVRPKGATPIETSLVPVYKQCTSANSTHGAPLAEGSCNPPVQESDYLTIGSPDANGQVAKSVGRLRLDVKAGNPATSDDEADVGITASVSDVRKKSDLSDYSGQLRAIATLRITDILNGTSLFDRPATTEDVTFTFTIPCATTADTTVGSTCATTTSVDAALAGLAREGKRAVWDVRQVDVFDGGADGVAATTPNTLFARQGVFIP
jgi:hypothetical protein